MIDDRNARSTSGRYRVLSVGIGAALLIGTVRLRRNAKCVPTTRRARFGVHLSIPA